MNFNNKQKHEQMKNEGEVSHFGRDMDFATKEAFNLLRTNIAYSFPAVEGDPRGRVIGVTSSNQSEGKSSISINIAFTLAEAGNHVLLIEGDLRRPVVAKYLNREYEAGLSDFLAGHAKNIINLGVLNDDLDVIYGGDIPLDPTILLDSNVMAKMLESLACKYDYIIIDLPPVLPVPDAVLMAKCLDGMLFVVRSEITHKSDIKEAIRRLKYTGVRVLGFVYNDFNDGPKRYYRKSDHYYVSSDKSTGKK